MKPPVEFVRKKLDNAIEIMCSLRYSIDIDLVADLQGVHKVSLQLKKIIKK